MSHTTVIFAGGEPEPAAVRRRLPDDRFVIAADGGLHGAQQLGITVDLIVGDLDSADPAATQRAVSSGTRVERHPTDKDATDLELALLAAVERAAQRVIVVGGASLNRVDHFMANALLLGGPRFASLRIEWLIQGAVVIPIRDEAVIEGAAGDIVTLLPVGGPAEDVTTAGLRWPLRLETLQPGSTRGVSNLMTTDRAVIRLGGGTLLAIHLQEEPA